MEIKLGIEQISVFRESYVFGFFVGGDFGFPGDFIMFAGKIGSDSEKNVAMVPIKLLPNRI